MNIRMSDNVYASVRKYVRSEGTCEYVTECGHGCVSVRTRRYVWTWEWGSGGVSVSMWTCQ